MFPHKSEFNNVSGDIYIMEKSPALIPVSIES